MRKALALVSQFAEDENGGTALEYVFIASLIAMVCVTVWETMGTKLNTRYVSVQNSF